MRYTERDIFSTYLGFRDHRLCWVFGHNYWRIPESPNGICLNCGHIAQDILYKVSRDARDREERDEWNSEERRCAVCNEVVEWNRWSRFRVIFDGAIVCGGSHKREYIKTYLMSFDPDLDRTREPLPVNWTWSSMRHLVLERDKHTCQNCATGQEITDNPEHHMNYDMKRSNLDVHHIQPRSQGGSDHPKNLITLCCDCHKKTFKKRYKVAMIERTKCKSLETYG